MGLLESIWGIWEGLGDMKRFRSVWDDFERFGRFGDFGYGFSVL